MPAGLRLTFDLDRLSGNWQRLVEMCPDAECAAVVKANAYGVGIEKAIPALANAGCKTFFVALPEEGVKVRNAASDVDVYILNGFFADCTDVYRQHRLMPVLGNPGEIRRWLAWRSDDNAALHIDTGMNRLGLSMEDARRMGDVDLRAVGIHLLMSHLACADMPRHVLNAAQLERFRSIAALYDGIPASLANSAGIHLGQHYHFGLVRPGIALYGGASHPDAKSDAVVTAEARILQIRKAEMGETVGYGATAILGRESRIAVLAAGYADGYLRAAGSGHPADGARISIAGHDAPIIGRVSMDLIAADVTDIPEQVLEQAEWAELFGETIDINETANVAGTIAYEFLTGLSGRAERIYVGGGFSS